MYSELPVLRHGLYSRTLSWLSCLLVFIFSTVVSAQVSLEANYPFLTDLADATGNYGDAVLEGDPTPMVPPSPGVPLCQNGVYGDQDVVIPNITSLDTTDFQVGIEFNLSVLPTDSRGTSIIVGSRLYRWAGIYVSQGGKVGALYNNSDFVWSDASVTLGAWQTAQLKFLNGVLQVVFEGQLVLEETVGVLDTDNQLDFTTSDYSRGVALNGCIRNLEIINGADLRVGPILAISKTDSVDPVVAGNELTYTVRVDNTGSASADNVVVTDTLPAEVTLVSTTGCAEDPVGAPACSLGTIAADSFAEYTVTVDVNPSASGVITNSATVDTLFVTSEETAVSAEADLSITKVDSADPSPAGNNQTLDYTIEVSNAGPSDASNVVVTDTLPSLVTFQSTSGCLNDPAGVPDCQLGTIAAGSSAVYTVRVGLPRTDQTIVNSVSVSSDTTDPDDSNNSAEESTELSAVPIPALGGIGLALLAFLMAGLGWVIVRRT